jgi:hypothetical protein
MDQYVRTYDGAKDSLYVSPYTPLNHEQVFGKNVHSMLMNMGVNAPRYEYSYLPLTGSQVLPMPTHMKTRKPLLGSRNPVEGREVAAALSALEPAQSGGFPSSVSQYEALHPSSAAYSASESQSSEDLTESTGAIPPELPPSVEAAYRKKCIQLKQRMNEVEEANDAARLRLARLNRSIQKLRLERAFLLEQLAKRTSTNVEDSEGSPSPPPTVRVPPSSSAHILMMIDKLTPLPS